MAGATAQLQDQGAFRLNVAARGYQILFRPDESNHCPGCGRAHWYVGRVTAECVFCGTALPLEGAHWYESGRTSCRFAPVEPVDWSERRRYERKAGDGRILQLLIDGQKHAFTVRDISVGGIKGEVTANLAAAERVQVVFERGRLVPADIRWIDGGVAGLSFSGPVLIDLTRPE